MKAKEALERRHSRSLCCMGKCEFGLVGSMLCFHCPESSAFLSVSPRLLPCLLTCASGVCSRAVFAVL